VPDILAPLVDVALGGVAEIPINDQIVSLARRIGPPVLRTLDAIHLVSAVYADADLVMAFDRRVLAVAGELGFRVVSPGRAILGA
jgi:predicted nucleic acid-binding protein